MNIPMADVAEFIYQEAQLLDDAQYQEWLDLFDEDGRYWVPLQGATQSDDEKSNSIADEDRSLLALRIERLRAGIAHSQQPGSQCQHVLQAPRLVQTSQGGDRITVRTPFTYAESRGDALVTLHGHYIHHLRLVSGRLKIALKRVNLVNSGSRLPMIQLFP